VNPAERGNQAAPADSRALLLDQIRQGKELRAVSRYESGGGRPRAPQVASRGEGSAVLTISEGVPACFDTDAVRTYRFPEGAANQRRKWSVSLVARKGTKVMCFVVAQSMVLLLYYWSLYVLFPFPASVIVLVVSLGAFGAFLFFFFSLPSFFYCHH